MQLFFDFHSFADRMFPVSLDFTIHVSNEVKWPSSDTLGT